MTSIFNIKTEEDFQIACLETFHYQYKNTEFYKKFVDFLGKNPDHISSINEIPFLPIELFKSHLILDKNFNFQNYFQSSGTTQVDKRSKHYIADFSLYEESIYASFSHFIGNPEDFVILGLLPNYTENSHSSLIYMVNFLMKKSAQPENGYFLYNHAELFQLLQKLEKLNKKILLFGVSFALLDFLDSQKEISNINFSNLTVIETGGMKGRKEEMTKHELLKILKNGFATDRIFSEYSMTELLSQAYSFGENRYTCPHWMRIMIRNTDDPLSYVENGKTGAINIIDLANKHSCSFIATQDLGKKTALGFEVLGRIDHSDIRGCSLLVTSFS